MVYTVANPSAAAAGSKVGHTTMYPWRSTMPSHAQCRRLDDTGLECTVLRSLDRPSCCSDTTTRSSEGAASRSVLLAVGTRAPASYALKHL
jgi:hypothetical protein